MTQIPSDDILEGWYKLRIRESEKLKTVLELYNMEIHHKKAGPDKVATPCMDDHQFKEEENEPVGELSTACSQIVSEMSVIGSHWET